MKRADCIAFGHTDRQTRGAFRQRVRSSQVNRCVNRSCNGFLRRLKMSRRRTCHLGYFCGGGGKEAFRKEKRSKWKSKSRSVCPSGVTCLKHFLSPWGRESGFGFYFLSFLFFRGQKGKREIGMTCTEKNAQGGQQKYFYKKVCFYFSAYQLFQRLHGLQVPQKKLSHKEWTCFNVAKTLFRVHRKHHGALAR